MVDPSTFRAALSRLASGISVVSCVSPDGRDHGMTVTALCSLSLDPPLILVCVDRAATMHPHLLTATHFAVSMLSLDQEALSRRFAETTDNKFDGVAFVRDAAGCPLLADALVHLECEMWAHHDGGDHTIFVGRVRRAATRDGEPLLHYRGGYAKLVR
ncbi:MAG TPA: flavin reductase family protein [Gemmatimonadaceae bacterium]|nr:flavin reductase family protein [Gemmatimonadaceae bacterium]